MMLIINPCFVNGLKELVDFAEANPLFLDDILDMMNGARPLAGDTEGYYFKDHFGTKIVYTIEIMPEYKLRHFSISMDNGRTMPHPIVVEEIMQILGFKKSIYQCVVEVEKRRNDPSVGILNVAEIITD